MQDSPSQNNPTRIFNRTFVTLLFVSMAMNMGQNMSNTLISKYAKFLGGTPEVIGMVSSLFAVTALAFKLISAPAIDTFNRKYILIGSMSVLGVAFSGFALSHSISALVFSRLIQGTAMAFTTTCCLTLASDALPQNKLGCGLGVFSLAQAICQAIGPTIGLTLAGNFGYNIAFASSAVMIFLSVITTFFIHNEHTSGRKFKIAVSSIIAKEALPPAVLMFFLSMTFSAISSFLVVYAEEYHVENIGYYFTVYALTLLITRPIVGRLSDTFGTVKVILPAMFFFALSFISISFSRTLVMFLFSAFISAFGYGACQPAVQALCMRCVPHERRGAGSCTSYIGTDCGMLAGPVIGGLIASSVGYPAMWRFMIIPILFAAAFTFFYRNTINRLEGFSAKK